MYYNYWNNAKLNICLKISFFLEKKNIHNKKELITNSAKFNQSKKNLKNSKYLARSKKL